MDNVVRKITRKTDGKGRVTLPTDFAHCLVALKRDGDVVMVRKVRSVVTRHCSFKHLMAGVRKGNLHAEVQTGRPVGGEAL